MKSKIHRKLLRQIERDIRNQVVIDQLKRISGRQRVMIHLRDNRVDYLFAAIILVLFGAPALADEARPQCPTPGEPCKVLFLNAQEERLLTGQNGILDTAAQGRQIDLGGFSVYFKSKIATATAGEVKPVEKPAVENKPAAPVDNATPK